MARAMDHTPTYTHFPGARAHSKDLARWVRARLQWIQEGDEVSKLFFDFQKKKVIADRVLGLCRSDGSLEEDLIEIRGLFGDHFHNIFSPYRFSDSIVAARNACYKVVPHKVFVVDRDRLDRDLTKDELFASLCSMKSGKSPGIDGLPCGFYKAM